ncbi:MAG: TlpA disulfide reductase family protein [Gemmatimonadota bacterium]|nr:TlpA disulfide reductase family protein [Gemmatimonadota bacterium]
MLRSQETGGAGGRRPWVASPSPKLVRATGARGSARVWALATLAGAVVLAAVWFSRQRIPPVVAGYPAPDFAVTDTEGEPVTLDSYRGKVLLLNVWATWCAPCREEMPSMQRLYDLFPREDFDIAAISIDARPERLGARGNPSGDPVAFARELGLTFPVLLDPSGGIQRTYRASRVPESFLIGRDGIIYKKVAGAAEWDSETNVELIRRLAGDGAGAGW